MTRIRFRHDMRRGLGSCQLALSRCANIEEYREDVLWGMQHALAYDAQCEGTRAIYLFEMAARFDDWSQFHSFAAAGAKRNLKDRGWRFAHHAELLALMAGAGYEPARRTMAELYERLLGAIRTGRPSPSGVWSAVDNYSRLCISTLTKALQSQAEREAFYLRVLADRGQLIQRRPALDTWFEDSWFEFEASETLGEERVRELLDGAKDEPAIARCLQAREQLRAGRETCQRQIRQQAEAETAQSIYDKLCGGAVPGRDLPLLLLRRVEKEKGAEETARLAHCYAAEDREDLRQAILRLFRTESCIAVFEDDGVSRLLRDAESENEALREEALRVLDELHSERVRDYALQRLERRPKDVDALYMLLRNFRPGDGKRLTALVKSVSLNERSGDWHGVFTAIRRLIERDGDADRELSAVLLPYILREGYCSFCRLHTLELMQERSLLTPELIEECRWDCSMDIRELVEKGQAGPLLPPSSEHERLKR